jgi:hypothetical protein
VANITKRRAKYEKPKSKKQSPKKARHKVQGTRRKRGNMSSKIYPAFSIL